ncbi:hypothetical protein [Devosia sp.]|uniref:hypothetical protein n=1 Tax=Devosia sp. TaxID=1871048 RepID=UPI001B1C0817|nr:hypothetical protein [Devosia sp.]MBO9588218.1 hypothetical protein [Devosia sp.]
MLALPSFLGFLLPLPAALLHQQDAAAPKRRAIRALHLSHHILRDVGLDDLENPADDPRWVQRPDLER